ncbi:uncharacterized protein LOC126293595 [Schistocerca gregaria]|uniref:uncharacterized protein LOC126293595 n=1 Tax=Schistocerca gregaria TaxID=7010 RepID=UPI00211EA245|nr:uncharacterized protein LOC126293595 [Schistocerca gregaria]
MPLPHASKPSSPRPNTKPRRPPPQQQLKQKIWPAPQPTKQHKATFQCVPPPPTHSNARNAKRGDQRRRHSRSPLLRSSRPSPQKPHQQDQIFRDDRLFSDLVSRQQLATTWARTTRPRQPAQPAIEPVPPTTTAPPGFTQTDDPDIPHDFRELSATELFVLEDRLAHHKDYPGRELDQRLDQAPRELQVLTHVLPRAATQEPIVPPGAPTVATAQDGVASTEAAPSGVAPPHLAIEEASEPLVAPTDDPSQAAVSAPVPAAQGLTVRCSKDRTRPSTTPGSLEIPEANLEALLLAETTMEVQTASRKRPATSDSDDQTETTVPNRRQ